MMRGQRRAEQDKSHHDDRGSWDCSKYKGEERWNRFCRKRLRRVGGFSAMAGFGGFGAGGRCRLVRWETDGGVGELDRDDGEEAGPEAGDWIRYQRWETEVVEG